MSEFLDTAVGAARAAGEVLNHYARNLQDLNIEAKPHNQLVSEADRSAVKAIIDIIQKNYPEHSILGEESGDLGGNEFQWIIDPLDGTNNFLNSFPFYSVSIALKHEDDLLVGVVYDPVHNELFAAHVGQGATLNQAPIHVSSKAGMLLALIGTDVPHRPDVDTARYLRIHERVMGESLGIRRGGSAALDLVYLAAGRLDAYWAMGMEAWDIAAAALIVQEAGGTISDINGGNDYLLNGNLLAADSRLFDKMLVILQSTEN